MAQGVLGGTRSNPCPHLPFGLQGLPPSLPAPQSLHDPVLPVPQPRGAPNPFSPSPSLSCFRPCCLTAPQWPSPLPPASWPCARCSEPIPSPPPHSASLLEPSLPGHRMCLCLERQHSLSGNFSRLRRAQGQARCQGQGQGGGPHAAWPGPALLTSRTLCSEHRPRGSGGPYRGYAGLTGGVRL